MRRIVCITSNLDGRRSRVQGLEVSREPDELLEHSVVCFEDVVQVLRRPMQRIFVEQTPALQSFDRSG